MGPEKQVQSGTHNYYCYNTMKYNVNNNANISVIHNIIFDIHILMFTIIYLLYSAKKTII